MNIYTGTLICTVSNYVPEKVHQMIIISRLLTNAGNVVEVLMQGRES